MNGAVYTHHTLLYMAYTTTNIWSMAKKITNSIEGFQCHWPARFFVFVAPPLGQKEVLGGGLQTSEIKLLYALFEDVTTSRIDIQLVSLTAD